jgi:hypothetical protein
MILLTLAAAAAAHWTGPRTEEYLGPGYFCGGGYRVLLKRGDRALILPQASGAPGARVIIAGRNVSVWSGAPQGPGRLVVHYGGTAVREHDQAGQVGYSISDETDFGLHLTSEAFKGFKRDGWFFSRANFANGADEGVQCLSAHSY